MNLSHFDANGNVFFNLLSDATALHRSARQKHGELLDLCKSNGVKFSDIESYLVNQAKRAGLYRKTMCNAKTGKMDYPAKSNLTHLSWYTAMRNFISWSKSNFKDYGVDLKKVARKNVVTKTIVVNKAERFGNRPRPIAPPVLNDKLNAAFGKLEIPAEGAIGDLQAAHSRVQAARPTPESNDLSDMIEPPPVDTLTAPVRNTLQTAEIQALFFRNMSVLGAVAKEKGALEEFNMLMLALGMDDEIIEDDEFFQDALDNAVSIPAN